VPSPPTHRLAVQLEEVQRPIHRRLPPPLLPVDTRKHQFADRSPEHPVHLGGPGFEVRSVIEHRHDRHDVAPTHDRVQMGQLTDHGRRRRVEADLLVGFAQGGLHRGLPGIEPPTREADLAAVVAHLHRPTGQQHLGTVRAFDQRDEDRRHPSVGERRQQRRRMLRHRIHQITDGRRDAGRPGWSVVFRPDVGSRDLLIPSSTWRSHSEGVQPSAAS
jgi:hypothetical protein